MYNFLNHFVQYGRLPPNIFKITDRMLEWLDCGNVIVNKQSLCKNGRIQTKGEQLLCSVNSVIDIFDLEKSVWLSS